MSEERFEAPEISLKKWTITAILISLEEWLLYKAGKIRIEVLDDQNNVIHVYGADQNNFENFNDELLDSILITVGEILDTFQNDPSNEKELSLEAIVAAQINKKRRRKKK